MLHISIYDHNNFLIHKKIENIREHWMEIMISSKITMFIVMKIILSQEPKM